MQRRFKCAVKLVSFSLLVLAPGFVQAACNADGYTVIFINGVWDTKQEAEADAAKLQKVLEQNFNEQKLSVKLAYNETHLAGGGDLVETYFPALDQFDLDTILRQMHDEVQTRKLLIVGHSQGAVYANKVYEYLIAHGEPADAVGVYAVATPANYVAGNGKYITYALDNTITNVAKYFGLNPLSENADILDFLQENNSAGPATGHGFIDVYLNGFGPRIKNDIKSELFVLRPTNATTTGDCFIPPQDTVAHKAEAAALVVGDPVLKVAVVSVVSGYKLTASVVGFTSNLAASAFGAVAGVFGHQDTAEERAAKDRALNDTGVALLKAAGFTSLTVKAADQLQDKKAKITDLGAAAILAVDDTPVDPTTTEPTTTAMVPIATTTFPTAPTTTMPVPDPHAPMPAAVVRQGSPDPAPPVESAATTSASTPTLSAPSNVTFSNWRSPDGSTYCDVINRTVNVSWDPVTGATSYEVWQYFSGDNHFISTTPLTSISDLNFSFGLNWAIPVSLKVVALDGAGDYATTSVSVNDAATDKTGPIVNAVVPVYGSTGVSTTTSVVLTYSEPVDPASLSGSLGLSQIIDLGDGFGPHWVSVPITASVNADTVTLTPTNLLATSSSYGVFASCGVKDLNGNHGGILTADLIHPSFTTGQ